MTTNRKKYKLTRTRKSSATSQPGNTPAARPTAAIAPTQPREPKPSEVAPAQSEEAQAAEAREQWPSPSFGPVLADVRQQLERAYRVLTVNGFLIVADPWNDLGDGKTWVLECEPTDKLAKDTDSADLARQCLESEGMATDRVSLKGQALYVTLSPPPQPITQVEVQPPPASPDSERGRLRLERLRETYGVNFAGPSSPSNRAIREEYKKAHYGDDPSLEYVLGEAIKHSAGPKGVSPAQSPQTAPSPSVEAQAAPQPASLAARVRQALHVAGVQVRRDPIQVGTSGDVVFVESNDKKSCVDIRRAFEGTGLYVPGEPVRLGGKLFLAVRREKPPEPAPLPSGSYRDITLRIPVGPARRAQVEEPRPAQLPPEIIPAPTPPGPTAAAQSPQAAPAGDGRKPSPKPNAVKGRARASKRRAKLVGRVINELLVLKAEPHFDREVPQDYEEAQAKFRRRDFYVFGAKAVKFPAIKNLLFTVKNIKRKPIGLAQKIVEIAEDVSPYTVAQDWKKCKPSAFRR